MMASELNWEKVRAAFVGNDAQSCVTAIAQDIESDVVLMVGHANRDAVEHMIATKQFALWSTSRRELWVKGLTSGNTFEVVEILVDCDADALLVKVRGDGPMCHTGARSCFNDSLA